MNQPKIERLLHVIKLMTGPVDYSVDELAEKLGTHRRTIYRYVNTFREAGFIVYKCGEAYRLGTESPGLRDLNKFVAFSAEEAALVNDLIAGLSDSNALKFSLRKKMATVFACADLAKVTDDKQMADNVHELTSAIGAHRCAVLHGYASGHSSVVRDRLVEPFEFTDNYVSVWCLDLDDNKCKQFRLSRMASVEVLNEEWQHEADHAVPFTDAFRISGVERTPVSLRLSLRAYNLLVEECPKAKKDVTPEPDEHFLLRTDVCGWLGIGRFVIGLLDEIDVIDPPEFRQWLKDTLVAHADKL